jgi:hypothetical protein
MNMHTKEKRWFHFSGIKTFFYKIFLAFACTYPGCTRTFSVVSNAKRHMRTHGVGLPSEDQLSESPCPPVPYIVGFEAPVVICSPEGVADLLKEPLKLRWVPPSAANNGLFGGSSLSSSAASASSGSGFTSGSSSSAGSSRARSLSGVGGAGDRHAPGPAGDVDFGARDVVMMNGDVGAAAAAAAGRRRPMNGIHLFRSTSAEWETTASTTSSPSGPPSPDSCGGESDVVKMNEDDDDFFKSFRNHRRVESERWVFLIYLYKHNVLTCVLTKVMEVACIEAVNSSSFIRNHTRFSHKNFFFWSPQEFLWFIFSIHRGVTECTNI